MENITKTSSIKQKLNPGHTTCAGCPAPLIVRTVLNAIKDPVVVCAATGCLEVATTIYPNTSWDLPFIHSAFENASATIAGVETAYQALLKKSQISLAEKNKINKKLNFTLKNNLKFLTFGGDGGTYDIGLQSLSGVIERGHDFLYICYNNEGYMNTGGQRSGATSQSANTTTTPIGKFSSGKIQLRKNLMEIVIAHNIAYAAQASIFNLFDLENKVKKALQFTGPKFINVLSPCPTIWKFASNQIMEIARTAVTTGFWPIYEFEQGKYTLNPDLKTLAPIEEFLKLQGRFAHLFKNEQGKKIIQEIQNYIHKNYEDIRKKTSVN